MKNKNSIFVIIGLITGIIAGIVLPEFMKCISFIGTIYINILKFMIIPILFTSIVVTIYQSKNINSKLILKVVALFIIMFVITFLITSLIVYFINVNNNFKFKNIEWDGEVTELKPTDIIVNLFPTNISSMIQNNSIFACILFSIFFGFCATKIKDSEIVIEIIDKLKQILYKMLEYIFYLTPIAVFSLIGNTIANNGNGIILIGIKYILIAYFCSIIALIFVMILPVWIFAKVNPIDYIKKVSKVWLMSFTTCSSLATLPTTIKICNEEFDIPEDITNLVVPLGCTIHMCGGAVSFALLGIFTSKLFGVELTFTLFMQMIISATLINMSAPGIPNGGIVIGATYLSLLGIPLEFIGFYSGIYKLLDMAYTTLNVTGDVTTNILISKEEG